MHSWYFPRLLTTLLSRELNEIARALDINIGDEETKDSSSKPFQANQGVSKEKETYASALKRQGTSIVNGGLSIVKSMVSGTDEKPVGMATQKNIEDAGQEESNTEVKKAKERVQVLRVPCDIQMELPMAEKRQDALLQRLKPILKHCWWARRRRRGIVQSPTSHYRK